jgi:formate dehydrogenase maturation protein FdhE
MIVKTEELVQECPKCGGPVVVSFINLPEKNEVIRKANCPDERCAVRTWQRSKKAKRNLKCFKLFCKECRKESAILVLSSRGLVCSDCKKEVS